MIEIQNLTKKIGSNTILNNLSISVRKGEILGFLGPNGAGKTTTMKIITSFWKPSEGRVLVDGIEVAENSMATRAKIGYLPETVPLYEDMKVKEYLKFAAEIRRIPKEKMKEKIKSAVEKCGLKEVYDRPIDELSKGFRQRIGLAQAIIHEPEILILDEPTTGLDPNQIAEIRDLIKKLGQEKTVIFSTHILQEVAAVCDRVIIINKGKIAGAGTPDELMKKGGQELIYVKIKGPREAILEKIKALENVARVSVRDKESDDIYGYEIEPRAEVDLREQLSLAVMSNNWSILEFNKKSASLEEVFRELTK